MSVSVMAVAVMAMAVMTVAVMAMAAPGAFVNLLHPAAFMMASNKRRLHSAWQIIKDRLAL